MNEALERIDLKLQTLLDRVTIQDKRFLAVPDAAAYAGVSDESIRRLLAAGKLTAFRPVPGRVVVDRRELDAVILASSRRPSQGRGMHQRNNED